MEKVNNPQHYNRFPMETIDMMEAIWGPEKLITFCEMNSFKYRMRAGSKPGELSDTDIHKALWYERKKDELLRKLD